jgi:alkaline phosphatase D
MDNFQVFSKKYFMNIFINLLIFLALYSCLHAQKNTFTIAFGSCGSQENPLPVFDVVVKHHPDLFIFLGDNIYGDTKNMDTLRAKYNRLGSKESFKHLSASTRILATWDDHDYGWNDIGRHYPFKQESKEIFLDFFKEPENSERRKHEGIYASEYISTNGKTLQIILLDNRTFRDDLLPYSDAVAKDRRYFYELDYAPHTSADSTLLGKEQWLWLEKELSKPADLRVICSGTQFGIEYNGYESWANFPKEQQRMLDLIKKTKEMSSRKLSEHVEDELFNKEKRNTPKIVKEPVIGESEVKPTKKKKPYYRKKYNKPKPVEVIPEPVKTDYSVKAFTIGLIFGIVATIIVINLIK